MLWILGCMRLAGTEHQVKASVAKLFDSTKEELPNFEVISD